MKKVNNIITTTLTNIFSNNKIVNSKIFNNKITLYVVAAIAFISLYRHIVMYEFSAVLLFFLIGALTYSFTKNMTIVLLTSFLVTIFVNMFKGLLGFKEGMETKETKETKDKKDNKDKKETNSLTSEEEDEVKVEDIENPLLQASKTMKSKDKGTSGYTNQIPLTPGLYTMPNKEQMSKQLGKASETEQAYDNLEKIMGSKNIQTMSTDTQDLIRQQNDLIKQLKSMTPALNDAMATLGSLDLSKLTGMFNKPPEKQE